MSEFQYEGRARAEYILLGLAVICNLSGLFTTLQEPDAALYASISRHMAERGDLVNLMSMGHDWLDKPHFPFWVAALSFNLFGISTFAYKLPAVLFLFLGARFTYLLARDLCGKRAGFIASFMLLCSEHIILSNTDVRAEPYLTALLVGAVYHFRKSMNLGDLQSDYEPDAVQGLASGNFVERLKTSIWNSPKSVTVHLVWACLLTACAIMTKGIFILVIIAGGFIFDLVISRNWSRLFNWRWLLVWLLIALFIFPEIYCLYRQFDLHPEKLIFGRHGVSGLRFFFWDSQFGRFLNTGPIKGSGEPLFFVHTLLWAYLPWPLVLLAASWTFLKDPQAQIKRGQAAKNGMFICAGCALSGFLLFSASRFQLPHYTNILFPFFSVISAAFLSRLDLTNNLMAAARESAVIRRMQYFVSGGLILALIILLVLFRPSINSYWVMVLAAHLVIGTWLVCNRMLRAKSVFLALVLSGLSSIFVNLVLNAQILPAILDYQAGSQAAFFMNRNYPGLAYRQSGEYSYALSFYADSRETFSDDPQDSSHRSLVYSDDPLFASKSALQPAVRVFSFKQYHTTKLSLPFLNAVSRTATLDTRYLYLIRH